MIGRLLHRHRQTTVEARLDELEATIDVKLRALLVTATQAIAEAVRAELERQRQRAEAAQPQTVPLGRPPTRSLLAVEDDAAPGTERRRALAALTASRTERQA